MSDWKGLNEFMTQEVTPKRSELEIVKDIQWVVNNKEISYDEKDTLIKKLELEYSQADFNIGE